MATADKDLEGLRKEHKELSDQLRRTGVLSLTVLGLFVISFSRACEKANGNDAKITLCQIKKISEISGQAPDISYIFEQFDPAEATCGEPCQAPSPSPVPTSDQRPTPSPKPSIRTTKLTIPPRQPFTSQQLSPTGSQSPLQSEVAQAESGSTVGSRSPTPEPEPTPQIASPETRQTPTEAQRQASDCQNKLQASLEELAQRWFGIEAPIPGIHVNIDLRYWVFFLPPLFFLSGIYLHILRMKLRLVGALGAHRLSTAKSEEITELDRLYFDNHSAYMRFPSGLAGTIFLIVYLLLPVYLFLSGVSFWRFWSTSSLIEIGFLPAAFTLYSVSYAHFVTKRVNEEIARITNLSERRNFISAALNKVKDLLQKIAQSYEHKRASGRKWNPRIQTLGLTITQNSCEKKAFRGYQVLIGAKGADWYTSYDLFEEASRFTSIQGRIMYASALLLALVVAVLILLPWFYAKMTNAPFRKSLFALAGGILIFTIIDFSSGGYYSGFGEAGMDSSFG
jgi:hypothetical protein